MALLARAIFFAKVGQKCHGCPGRFPAEFRPGNPGRVGTRFSPNRPSDFGKLPSGLSLSSSLPSALKAQARREPQIRRQGRRRSSRNRTSAIGNVP